MSHPGRGPARSAGIDGKANGVGDRRAAVGVHPQGMEVAT
jgi:hypothetical protein